MESPQRGGLSPHELVTAILGQTDRIAVTGSSGWFGTTALELLLDICDTHPDQVVGYASSARRFRLPSGRQLEVRALPDLLSDPAPSVLLHFAYLTRARATQLGTSAYTASNISISTLVLEAIRRHRPRLVVTASSGAVYEPDGSLAHDLAANPYGSLKVLDELAFSRAAEQVGAGWAIPRVFSVAGPGMTSPEKYALGSMISMARAGGPIEITAQRPVVRSYCGVDEVIALALWSAAQERSSVFDTGGHVVEMADLAAVVASEVGDDCAVVRRKFDPAAEADRYVGEATVFAELVAQSGLSTVSLADLIRSTAQKRGAEC